VPVYFSTTPEGCPFIRGARLLEGAHLLEEIRYLISLTCHECFYGSSDLLLEVEFSVYKRFFSCVAIALKRTNTIGSI
jgi:hypothetical protein